MSGQLQQKEPWLNFRMLKWARVRCERTVEEAAKKLNKPVEAIKAWESGDKTPTVRQARELADFYGRPFLEFFLNNPPDIPAPTSIPDYRMHAGVTPPRQVREVLDLQQWVETQRVNALDLFEEVGDEPPNIPDALFSTAKEKPETVARRAREHIGYSPQEQMALPKSKPEQLPAILRRKLESIGVLTLKKSEMGAYGIRGICLAEFPLPIIAFSAEAPTAQSFTLAHEFGHILLRDSGISGRRRVDQPPVEDWCDRFAAAFLMPADQMSVLAGPAPKVPAPKFSDIELTRLSEMFRVSQHAMLIRLVHLGYVRASYYWDVKKPEFDAAEGNYKSFGRSKYYGARYRNVQGDLYTGLVLEAWGAGRITNHNAAEFMGIKNMSHLYDIRENFAP